MADTPISEIIKTALSGVKEALDANTVIGEPMTVLDHTVIVPISKISCGIATGGSDFGGKKEDTKKNFGGGGGTGITVTPVAFLVISSDGNVKMLNVNENSGYASAKVADTLAAVDGIIDKAPDMISKIAGLFKKKKAEQVSAEDAEKSDSEGQENQ
ncbi:MAG: sporulation protein YtfJ [Clostridia bacterium]|nr:sporulation protein YtfJ [Clostridia bacterium]